MNLKDIKQPFIDQFPGDFSGNTEPRITPKVLFSTVKPADFQYPEKIRFNEELSAEIGLGNYEENDLHFLVGNHLPPSMKTYATAYAGHQFGNWAGQLGDGRVIFAGEIQNSKGKSTEIQWKGAGVTPYSRFADGRAVLRSSIREFLMSEAMHYLGIPTTRALSLCLTGEQVVRDIMYNGNPQEEKGSVVIRTAESFLRFGHFELLSAQGEKSILKQLTDNLIENHFPEIQSEGTQKYKDFYENVSKRTADLMVEWYRVGFVHGVMNTDNMSILGLTMDYGPFSMLDEFDLNFTPNTTDLPGRRYSYGKQAQIAQWNLWQLANALYPLIEDQSFLEKVLDEYNQYFWEQHDQMLCRKFGFEELLEGDEAFFINWQTLMQELRLDYTLFFSTLEKTSEDVSAFQEVSYEVWDKEKTTRMSTFLKEYKSRLTKNIISEEESKKMMQKSNPKFILRNYLLFECIEEVNNGKTEMLNQLIDALKKPYNEQDIKFSHKRPDKYTGITGCSLLSCSS